MQVLANGYRGISLLFEVNADRLLYLATIAAALAVVIWFSPF